MILVKVNLSFRKTKVKVYFCKDLTGRVLCTAASTLSARAIQSVAAGVCQVLAAVFELCVQVGFEAAEVNH